MRMQPANEATWIGALNAGDRSAADMLWQVYHQKLLKLASRQLGGQTSAMANEEDVVVSAFKSFYRAVDEKRVSDLEADDIWRLLVTITGRKAIKLIRHEKADKRGLDVTDSDDNLLETIIGEEPDPEFTMAVVDQFKHLNDKLVDEEMRLLVYRKLEGYGNAEIAQELNCSVRTIKRRLEIVRGFLQEELDTSFLT